MSYKDLEVYHEAKRLAVEVHQVSMTFPKFEMYEEGSQLRRASKSVVSNIVEGYGRKRYKNDFVRHLIFSLSECDETRLHLELLFETGSMRDQIKCNELKAAYDVLSKKLNRFIQSVEQTF